MSAPIAVFCTSAAMGGLELNAIRMAVWLKDAGHPIAFIARANTAIYRRAEMLTLVDKTTTLAASRSMLWQLVKILRKNRFHTLFVHTSRDMRRAVIANLLTFNRTRLVFVQHMQIGVKKRDWLHTWFFRHLKAWITPLPYLATQVRTMTHFDQKRIFEIPFGIELKPLVRKKPCRTHARLRLHLPVAPIIVGIIGRFDRQKNQTLLIEAASALIAEGYPIHVLLVGENTLDDHADYETQLRLAARAAGVESSVHFRPFTDDTTTIYAALDVFVLTSQAETFGMVTAEAMAAGLPIVATQSGGTPEIVRDHRTGLLFQPNDADDLVASLRILLDFPELRRRFAQAAAQDARQRFSHKKYIAELDAVIDKIA
ncbi:MAG: glycosyltransferase family 4 protein [Spirochaetes bacterium]|nr:glycosyltransferase family 4 protein [Spirochaetota bacterium]